MRIRTENVTWQEIDGELVILDLQRSTYLTTNVVGALLAKFLTQDRSLDDLVDLLVSTYGIDIDTATQDAEAFLQQLASKELLIADDA
ncbi:PqqD family protein [Micropruina glycogenica]|uniref:Coenzyme PQQ synthesis protein D (PqqD) n=1 Tax=Micropruina glycogenica TaxID=75385 RepID=A0A2N9JC42_9ACTN|nr:PqqD family protein [Micropruina glycogenica]SPD85110.1 Coenzyme PQQ synthesis protein D (PqqD) [Micropruina glycogenica]